VDVVVTSEEDALPCADSPGRVIGPALAEGKVVLYERAWRSSARLGVAKPAEAGEDAECDGNRER